MGKKYLIIIVILLVFLGLGFFYFFKHSIRYVDDCGKALIESGRDYVICSMDANGKLYLTNDKRTFNHDEYLGLHLNVQKLNKYFDPYRMCIYSNMPNYQKEMPNETHQELKFCSGPYSQQNSNNIRFSGYLADLPGEYTIGEIYLFPNLNLTKQEFFSNLNKSVLVFSMKGVIK